MSLIGTSLPRIESRNKVTGRAIYGDDISLPGMVIGKILRSPYAHARIVSVDTSRAESMDGVFAVVTGADAQYIFGENIADEYPLARGKVRYVGDEVAAVAAVSEACAVAALNAIEVAYETLPAVFEPIEAMKKDAPLIHESSPRNVALHVDFKRGDPEAAFAEADVVVEGEFYTSNVYQGYLEPVNAVADWQPPRLTLYTALQSPYRSRINIARALGLSVSQIRIVCPEMGGGFGGKVSTNLKVPLIAALLSMKCGRPVRITLTREEDMEAGRPRAGTVVRSSLALKKDGTFLARKTHIIYDNGAYTGFSASVMKTMAVRAENIYRFKACETQADLVYTNKTPTGPYRGFGTPMALFALESLVDMASEKIGMDPLEIRLKNIAQKGDVTLHGYVFNTCGLKECLESVKKMRDADKERQVSSCSTTVKRGYGVALCIHNSGNRLSFGPFDGSTAIVRCEEDGYITVFSGEQDCGQGSDSVLAQIAAEVIGVGYDRVRVLTKDSEVSPFGIGTFASRVTMMGGNAVRLAAGKVRERLISEAAVMLNCKPQELFISNGIVQSKVDPAKHIEISEIARSVLHKTRGEHILERAVFFANTEVDQKTLYGNVSLGYCFGAQLCEVEVDVETGKVRIPKVYAAYDVGKVLNPMGAEGQLQGGIVQGIGMALTEKLAYAEDGRLQNPNFRDYRMMNIVDIPEVRIEFIETNEPNGPFGAKSIAEASMDPTPAAVANAVANALGARAFRLPIEPEHVITLAEGGARCC